MRRPLRAWLVLVALLPAGGQVAAQGRNAQAELDATYQEAATLFGRQDYAAAARRLERVLQLARQVHGEDHAETAKYMSDLALLYAAQGQFAQSEPLYRRSLQIKEARLGKDHTGVAVTLNGMAGMYEQQGLYAQAEPLYRRSVQIYEDRLGKDHPDLAGTLNNLAGLYKAQARYAQAEALYQRTIQIQETKLGKDHADLANTLNNLATLYTVQGRFVQAEPLLERSLRIREARLGADHPQVGNSLNNLANLYKDQGQYGKALPLLERSLRIHEVRLGKDHPIVALCVSNLGWMYNQQGQYARAEQLYQRSLQTREATLGPNHPDVALSLNNLGAMYREQGEYAKAEPLLRRSLQIKETALGKDHPEVATPLGNLAGLYQARGQHDQAEQLYRRGLKVQETTLGPDHPDVAQSLHNLMALHVNRQDWAEAATAADRSRRIVRGHVARTLPALAEQEQLTFLRANDQWRLHAALSLGLLRQDDAAVTARSATWLLNGKGVAHEALAQRALLERDGADPARRDLVRQLQDLRRQRAALALAAPRAGQEQQRRQQLDDLAERQQQLERQLGREVAGSDPWVELDTVRRALPTDALLVDIALFGIRNFEAKGKESGWEPAHYAAWVIPPAGQGDVRVIDLGEAESIDAGVALVRKALADAAAPRGTIRTEGEGEAEKSLRESLDVLARLVLHPLLEAIGERKRLLLSPDAALWLVPWSALPLPDGSYTVERYSVRLLQSGRDLVATPHRAAQPTAPLLLADPAFGTAPAERRAVKSGESLADLLPAVGRLPGTRAEAAAVKPALAAYAGTVPRLFLDEEASKATFRREAIRPRLLMLSTHGYFLQDVHVAPADERLAVVEEGSRSTRMTLPPLANPLLRCGLLLAGANSRGAGAEQGVLTGLEIASTDLRGTELVVLSACETGLGQVHVGEGVAGLRQAFQLAGAEAVLASLWSVDDRATADLMKRFFAALTKDRDKAEVLSAVQREMIKARRERNGAAHPFYWAAFTLTGVPEEVLARRPSATHR